MSNIIDSIQLSGVTYTIQGSGGGGSPTVELTQAEYDALVTAGTVSQNTYYIITDATAGDLTQYWTSAQTQSAITSATSGKVDTSTYNTYTAATDTAINGKQDTLVSGTNIKTVNNQSLLGSGNIDIQGGGGKAIEAGRGIAITTGETADTVSINLPISAGTGADSLVVGVNCQANGSKSFVGGQNSTGYSEGSFAFGQNCKASQWSIAVGNWADASNIRCAAAFGEFNKVIGNIYSDASATTIFSVGNGSDTSTLAHNAFEIRKNGDIYLSLNGQDVKLQDQLGGSYVTTDTEQTISGRKIFTYSASSGKAIEFKQTSNSAKVGFSVKNSADTNNEVASFEFRPNTFTVDNVQHPLMYFGHYRNTNTANAGVPQTVIGFRQYDQLNAAAYHYLMPLPEKAKTPFSLTTSFKDYYAPIGFKNGSTMITADNTGVVDLSSELDGLKLKKLTQAEYDALTTKDDNTVYFIGDSTNGYTIKIGNASVY